MKEALTVLGLALLLFASGCKRASFENRVQPKDGEKSSDDLKGIDGKEAPIKDSNQKLELEVSVPSPEVKAGGDKIQAKAKIKNGPEDPAVSWEIKGPSDRTDIGSIDQNGVYTSPANTDKKFPLVITAILKADPTVSASTPLVVLPKGQIFTACTRNNVIFPILAHVYQINTTATKIPDFKNTVEARKVTTVCMDKYAVAPRNFSDGFPDVPQLFEYFALQTSTILQVPADGDYVFQLNSDDGSKLSIDGNLVIDNDGLHQAYGPGPDDSQTVGMKEATINLKAGDHPLTLDYFQGPKFRIALELKWKKPGSTLFEYVPREAFK